MIPKIIHYCWFGRGKLNSQQVNCLQSWVSFLPDYEIIRWDESNFDINFCRYTASAYEYGKFAFISDVCRLFALQKVGGIYLDLDMLLLKKLDIFLEYDFFLGYEAPNRYSAGIIGAKKGNVVVEKLLSEYSKSEFNPKFPILIPDFLMSHIQAGDVKAFPEDYFYPLSFQRRKEDFLPYLTKNSHAVHLWNHSWISENELFKKYQFLKGISIFINNLIRFPAFRNKFYLNDVKKSLITALKSFVYKKLISFRNGRRS